MQRYDVGVPFGGTVGGAVLLEHRNYLSPTQLGRRRIFDEDVLTFFVPLHAVALVGDTEIHGDTVDGLDILLDLG